MRRTVLLAIAGLALANSSARSQVDLSSYADANGFIDVQALTCAQLANTWQEDADARLWRQRPLLSCGGSALKSVQRSCRGSRNQC